MEHRKKNKEKKGAENAKWRQYDIGYIKISSKRCQIHEDFIKIMSNAFVKSLTETTCSNNNIFVRFFEVQLGRPGRE